jgi:hypothetical protein
MPTIATQTNGPGDYCGAKNPPPRGRRPAPPNVCFRKGLKSGFAAASQKAETEAGKAKTLAKKKEAISAVLGRKKVVEDIRTKGLSALKKDLHVDKLLKDEVRSIITRYTGTPQAVPGYSSMSLPQLRQELVNRGWQR